VKGAFTGAVSDRKGRFEEAHGGTLFIDEVGDITPAVQVKLLRAIQFGEVQRVGSNEAVQLDVRIIAATNRDLEGMIEDGGFREDLYYRLNVIEIPLPPLRERKTDIPLLVDQFIRRYAETNGKEIKGITFQALDILMKYEFPGNIRELENTIERSVILCRGDRITVHDLPSGLVRAAGRPQPDELGSEGPAARGSTATAAQAVPNGDEVQQNSAGCGEMPAQAGEGRGGGASAGRPVGGSDHAPPGSNQTPGGSETHPDHAAGAHSSLDDILSEKEAELILAALARSQGNQSRAAQELGISERKLRSRMERLGLENTFAQAR
jgi:DNA-binding NtrC family response regulator